MDPFNVSNEAAADLETGKVNGEILTKNILLLLFGFLAFCDNILIITVFYKFKMDPKKEPYVYLMTVLAITDVVNGLGASIAAIERIRVQLTSPYVTKLECIGTSTPLIIGMISSQVALACIGVDRFWSLYKPFMYKAKNHKKYAYLCLFVSFFIAFCFSSVMFIGVDFQARPPVCNLAASATFTFQTLWTVFSVTVATFVFMTYIFVFKLLRQRISANSAANETPESANSAANETLVSANSAANETPGSATSAANETLGSANSAANETPGSADSAANETPRSATCAANETPGSANSAANKTLGSATSAANETSGSANSAANETLGSSNSAANGTLGSADSAPNETPGKQPLRTAANRLHRNDIKATKAIIVVLSVYLVFWVFPNLVHNICKLAGASAKLKGRIGPFVAIGSAFSSSINILVYTMKLKSFRKNLRKFVDTPISKFSRSVVPTVSCECNHNNKRSTQYIAKSEMILL